MIKPAVVAAAPKVTLSATIVAGKKTNRAKVKSPRRARRYGPYIGNGSVTAPPGFRKSGAPQDMKARGKGSVLVCLSMPLENFNRMNELARRKRMNRSHLIRDLVDKLHASLEWNS